MNVVKKNLIFCIFILFLSLFIILLGNKTHMINTYKGEAIYVEDLKVGDFIENGAMLYGSENYHFNIYSGAFADGVYLCYSQVDDVICDNSDSRVSFSQSHYISSYNTIFSRETNYEGWIYKGIVVYGRYYYLLFVPANYKSDIIQTPEYDNNYEIETNCTSGTDTSYKWYKTVDITDYYTSSSTGEQIELAYNNGTFLLDRKNANENNTITITFEFDANKGDIISFETRGSSSITFAGTYYYDDGMSKEVYLNDTKITDFDDYLLFKNFEIEVTTSGKQKLQFVLEDAYYCYGGNCWRNYGLTYYIKNLQLRTIINNGAQLDYTKVSLGDEVHYSATCFDGYTLIDSIVYDKEIKGETEIEVSEPLEEVEEENPNTTDIVLGLIVIVIITCIAIVIFAKKIQKLRE